MAVTWSSVFRISISLLLLAAIVIACFTLPIEKILKDFLLWTDQNVGRWGPLVLAVAYIPLTVLAVPASILTLGGGYLYGLLMGFIADSVGATIGATAAFLLGRTIGRSYVVSKLNDYPKFQAVSIAIERSGFKIAFLLRLAPLLPFNMLNYLLAVTPISISEYVLSAWLGMMPITLALVYAGTTVKDLSDVTHGWGDISVSRWVMIILSVVISVVVMICVTLVAKSSLEKALAEEQDQDLEDTSTSSQSSTMVDRPSNANHSLITRGDHHRTSQSSTIVDSASNSRQPLITKGDPEGDIIEP